MRASVRVVTRGVGVLLLAMPAIAAEPAHAKEAAEPAHAEEAAEPAHAEEAAEAALVTDRPGNGNSARTVLAMHLQVEGGASYAYDALSGDDAHLVGFPLELRFGVVDWMELRVISSVVGLDVTRTLGRRVASPTDTLVGTKLQLLDNAGWAPDLALVADAILPSGSGAFTGGAASVDTRLSSAWSLPEGLGVLLNAGMDVPKDGAGRYAQILYVANLGYAPPFGDGAFAVFAESYGLVRLGGRPDVAQIDVGMTYLITPVWQIDAYSQHALTSASPDLQISVGLSTRL
jgi:hypothetical protein